MKEILKVEHLSKIYGKNDALIKAVDDVSFSVKEGEFVAIIGASGSGKSTLLHLMGGIDKPTSGTIYINNQDIYSLSSDDLAIFRRKNIGLIYQFYNLIPILTVEENIKLPILLDKRKVNDQEFKKLIDLLKLELRIDHLPNELSGGQQQRTAIGRALITKPAIILADEPTGNLDSKTGQEIIALLKQLNKEYKQTIILVTHDLELANMSDRIIKISDGKVISDGAINECVI